MSSPSSPASDSMPPLAPGPTAFSGPSGHAPAAFSPAPAPSLSRRERRRGRDVFATTRVRALTSADFFAWRSFVADVHEGSSSMSDHDALGIWQRIVAVPAQLHGLIAESGGRFEAVLFFHEQLQPSTGASRVVIDEISVREPAREAALRTTLLAAVVDAAEALGASAVRWNVDSHDAEGIARSERFGHAVQVVTYEAAVGREAREQAAATPGAAVPAVEAAPPRDAYGAPAHPTAASPWGAVPAWNGGHEQGGSL